MSDYETMNKLINNSYEESVMLRRIVYFDINTFINRFERGTLEKDKYFCLTESISEGFYYNVIYPYFDNCAIESKLLLKIRFGKNRNTYIKFKDTKAYRDRLISYFTYLTQNGIKGTKPPKYKDEFAIKQLVRNIMILFPDFGFTIGYYKENSKSTQSQDTVYKLCLI